jgi:hypothetical protein
MEDIHALRPASLYPVSPQRLFIYRSVEPQHHPHPTRRSTDSPHQLQAIPGQICPRPSQLTLLVYLNLH